MLRRKSDHLESVIDELENYKHYKGCLSRLDNILVISHEFLLNSRDQYSHIKINYSIGLIYSLKKEYLQSIQVLTKALSMLRNMADFDGVLEAKILFALALNYSELNIDYKYDAFFNKAKKRLLHLNEFEEVIKILIKRAMHEFNGKNNGEAGLPYIEEALLLLRNQAYIHGSQYYLEIGNFYLYADDNVMMGIVYYLKGLDSAITNEQIEQEMHLRLRLTYCYENIDNYEEVIHYLEPLFKCGKYEQLDYYLKFNLAENLIRAYSAIGNEEKVLTYIAVIEEIESIEDENIVEQTEEVFNLIKVKYLINFKKDKLNTAVPYLDSAKKTYGKYKDNFLFYSFDMELLLVEAEIMYLNGQYEESFLTLNTAMDVAVKYKRQKQLANIYKKQAKVLEKMQDYSHALQYYRLYDDLMKKWYERHSTQYTESLQRKHDIAYKQEQIIELNLLKEHLLIRNNTDKLTKIGNRNMLDEIIRYRLKKSSFFPTGMLMIDIDNFKLYNDNYGHVRGDDVIRQVAFSIKSACYKDSFIPIRYGGEEFVVILDKATRKDVIFIAKEIKKNINLLNIQHEYNNNERKVTASIGVSFSLSGEKELEKMLKEADFALYKAKINGKNQYVCFEES